MWALSLPLVFKHRMRFGWPATSSVRATADLDNIDAYEVPNDADSKYVAEQGRPCTAGPTAIYITEGGIGQYRQQ